MVFSFARKPQEELSANIFVEYAEKVETFMLLWETAVKCHCVEDHLMEQMIRHSDLCEYLSN
jgi:hypothetical protein